MAVVLGNLALLTDRKIRPISFEVVSNASKRDLNYAISGSYCYGCLAAKGVEWDGRGQRVVARGKANSKVNGVDFDSDEENGSGDGEEDLVDLETEVRNRAKEIEEMEELEKKAEELYYKVEEETKGKDETEEEKRLRVKKELEKVAKEQAERRATAQLMFELGQKAYGKGMYGRAIEFLEAALTIIPRPSLFGGEVGVCSIVADGDREAHCRDGRCIS